MPEVPTSKAGFVFEGLKYLIKQPLLELSVRTGKPFLRPMSAGILLTTRCNLDCPFCFIDKTSDFKDPMSKKEVMSLINELSKFGIKQLTLSGGEPLVEPDLYDYIKYAKSLGMSVGFTTNGTLLTGRAIHQIIESGVDRVTVSIEGKKDSHEYLRGKNTYDKTIEGFKKLSKASFENNSKPKIRINTIVFEKNLNDLNWLFDFAKENHADLNIMPFTYDTVTAVKARNLKDLDAKKLWPQDTAKLDKTIDMLKARKRKEGVLFNQDHFLELMKAYYKNPHYVNRQCKKGAYHMSIARDGEVSFCGRTGVVGNTKNQSVPKIWNSEKFKNARLIMRDCKCCLLNCNYTPPVWDLLKDFVIYPVLRKFGV